MMKDTIRVALARWRDREPNMASETFRNDLADEIALLLREKGSYTEYGEYELDEQKARASWVCSICGENTFEVDSDYIGSGTNHLGCELKSQEEIDEYVEDIDEQAYAQGRKSSYIQGSEEVDGMYFDDEVKGWEEAVGYKEPVQTLDDGGGITYRDKVDLQKQIYTEMTSDGLPEGGDSQAVLDSHKLAEEIVDNKEEKYIFESPDGGKTVFKRKFGSDKRELVKDWKTISE